MNPVSRLTHVTRYIETLSPARYAGVTGLLLFGFFYLFWIVVGAYTLRTALPVAGIPAAVYAIVSYGVRTVRGRTS
jgi:hypothetical protein